MKDINKIRQAMQKRLPDKRYQHTIGVADTAACLAMRYGCDIRRAQLAGLLHDCAKFMSENLILKECKKAGIEISEAEHKAPHLLHGKLGAWYAQKQYGVEDEEILSAIRIHTTGKPGMTLLEQIIFAADYIEPGRKEIPGLAEIRAVIFRDLDLATKMILENTLHYLDETAVVLDPHTERTLAYYQALILSQKKGEKK